MQTQQIPDLTLWPDVGLSGTDDGQEPLDWRKYVLKDFGIYADRLGMMSGIGLGGLSAEVDYFRTPSGDYVARTPMLELAPEDYAWMRENRIPYHGMMALGDEGDVYRYDGFHGFFKKLFKKAKSAVKSVVKKVGSAVKKVIKKIPGGKYLVKLGEKVWKTATKFVKPLVKFVGKYGVQIIGEKGKARRLKFKSEGSAKAFQKALKKSAEHEKKHKTRKRKAQQAVRRRKIRARRAPAMPRGMRAAMMWRPPPPWMYYQRPPVRAR